jgi:anti-sigma factor RsiW
VTDDTSPHDPHDPLDDTRDAEGPGPGGPLASCPDLPVASLVAWLDGEAPADEAARIASHVASCERCAREADLLRRTGDLVAQLPHDAASAGFVDRVLHAVHEDEKATAPAAAATGRVVPLRPWSVGRRAAAAAAILAVAGGAWWIAASPSDPGRLSSREEEEIARDLYVLAHLETLSEAEEEELAAIADDLDAIEAAADTEGDDG